MSHSHIYVLYHDHCADGFCAAWVFWRQLRDTAHYIPCSYQHPLPDIPDGSKVYMVDFSASRDEIEALAKRCELTILDHHKTAQANLAGLPFAYFDLNQSGAALAWKHIYPEQPTPPLVNYVEDRDLWRWQLPHSRELSAAIAMLEPDFKQWDHFHQQLLSEIGLYSAIKTGELLLKQQSLAVQRQADQAILYEVAPYGQVAFVSASAYQSEVGEELLKRYPEAKFACCFVVGLDSVRCSLRSRGDFNVAEVAQAFGGGHLSAAGCLLAPPYNRLLAFLGPKPLLKQQESANHESL